MRSLIPWIAGVLIAAVLVLSNDLFLFESIIVTSSSMEPTLLPNERIFLQKMFFYPLRRFDVVVIRSSKFDHRIVKRIVAMPGECVSLEEGWKVRVQSSQSFGYEDSVLVKNFKIEKVNELKHLFQLRINPDIHYDTVYGGKEPYCLKPDEYFVLGDNRLASGDSRFYGPFLKSEIVGRLTRIWYSYDKKQTHIRDERLGLSVR